MGDTYFHTTLDSVVKQGERYLSSFDNGIILQSEIENLIHLTNEGLERKKPDLFALSYFYLGHSNKELAELNFTQKTKRVHEIYYEEFWMRARQTGARQGYCQSLNRCLWALQSNGSRNRQQSTYCAICAGYSGIDIENAD